MLEIAENKEKINQKKNTINNEATNRGLIFFVNFPIRRGAKDRFTKIDIDAIKYITIRIIVLNIDDQIIITGNWRPGMSWIKLILSIN